MTELQARVEQALLARATAHGFEGELWTLDRVAEVIQRLTGVRHPDGCSSAVSRETLTSGGYAGWS